MNSLEPTQPTYDRRAKLSVLASGSGTNFENIVHACRNDLIRADVTHLIVNRNDAGAIQRAENLNIPFTVISHRAFEDRDAFDGAVAKRLSDFSPDLVVLAGWMRLAGAPLLDAFNQRILNIHPSLLPSFKGMHAIRQAWDAGVKITGCSVHVVTKALDDGPIIAQHAVVVADSLSETESRVHEAEYVLYPRAIQAYLNEII